MKSNIKFKELNNLQSKSSGNITYDLLYKLLCEESMSHFNLIDYFRYNKELSVKSIAGLFNFLEYLGYTNNISIDEAVKAIQDVKRFNNFRYTDIVRKANEPSQGTRTKIEKEI